jgi:4-hydroxybenzoate polyprenyltransferase
MIFEARASNYFSPSIKIILLLRKLIDLIFYSNLWIALCAAAMCAQTQFILTGQLALSWLLGLIFFATLLIYALHRIIGISKVSEFREMERYAIIEKFKNHITFYAVISGIGGAICFWNVSLAIQLSLIIPGIISLGYVIPFLNGKKRLRDFNHIKIFLIAIVWSWVTVFLPALEVGVASTLPVGLMILERALFIFAITLPFDIRDLKVDSHSNVQTIPTVIGIKKTKILGTVSLAFAFTLAVIICLSSSYNVNVLLGLSISFLSTWFFIHQSDKIKHDYFFTGVIDGTMILQFLLIWSCSSIF